MRKHNPWIQETGRAPWPDRRCGFADKAFNSCVAKQSPGARAEAGGLRGGSHVPPFPSVWDVTGRHVPTVAAGRGHVVLGAVASATRGREWRAGEITSPEQCPQEAERCAPASSGPAREDQYEESAEVC
jgi:hypothetical protein